MRQPTTPPDGLDRILGPAGVMFLAFSALSPVVSFYLGGDAVLHFAGTGAGLAYVLGGLASALFAVLYAEVGAAFPGAGGLYPTLSGLFGPGLSYPYIVLLAPIACASGAFAALGFADYLRVLIPGAPLLPTAILTLGVAALASIVRLRTSTRITGVFLAVEMAAIGVLCLAAAHPVRSLVAVALHPVVLVGGRLQPTSIGAVALGAVSGLWATGGSNWALYFAEEMRDAERRIGRTIAWTGLLAAGVVAAPMVLLVLAVKDPAAVLSQEAPIAAFLKANAPAWVVSFVAVCVLAATLNCLIAGTMGFSRYLFATGRDGVWPAAVNRLLGRLSPRFKTPVAATLALSLLAALACVFSEKQLLILLSGNVSDYILISLAVIVGRRQGRTGRSYRAPFYPATPIFGLGLSVLALVADWLDPDAGRPSVLLLSGIFLAAYLYYRLRLRQARSAFFSQGAPLAPD